MNWTIEDSNRQYRIDGWGDGYFAINPDGHLCVHPDGNGAGIDLLALAQQVHNAGLSWPVLVRFPGILRTQLDRLCSAFERAMRQHDYSAGYTAVYPIKVNQQRHVVEPIAEHGGDRIGLEAGSKSELMAIMGMAPPGCKVICNGYKDAGYVRLALVALQAGLDVTLVIEKLSELDTVIAVAGELAVRPQLGLRVRLSAATGGNWQNTGGDRSKFGFTAAGTLALLEHLQAHEMTGCVHMLHCHPGSQISDIAVLRRALQEVAQTWSGLRAAGLPLAQVNVGGGLGVDYDGSASDSVCSANYDRERYADTVVDVVAQLCREQGLKQPRLLSESGRALSAHHAVLVTQVIDTEQVLDTADVPDAAGYRPFRALLDSLADDRAAASVYAGAEQALHALRARFAAGAMTLAQRALGESLYYAVCRRLQQVLQDTASDPELLDAVNRKLADKYFCNLSVFQSMPDVWGIDQVFPVVPLQRLAEQPRRRATLHDLTCDSDGHIEYYVDADGVGHSLALHALPAGEPYLLGFFLLGAYQEILGDMHNLFGDTDAVNVEVHEDGRVQLIEPRHGDTVHELLRYVEFEPKQLLNRFNQRLLAADLDDAQRAQYLRLYESSMSDTTYLDYE